MATGTGTSSWVELVSLGAQVAEPMGYGGLATTLLFGIFYFGIKNLSLGNTDGRHRYRLAQSIFAYAFIAGLVAMIGAMVLYAMDAWLVKPAEVVRLQESADRHIRDGFYVEAQKNLDDALLLDQVNPSTLNLLGRLRYEQSRFAESESYFQRALDLSGGRNLGWLGNIAAAQLQQRKFSEASNTLERLQALTTPDYGDLLNLAHAYAMQQRYADARILYCKILHLSKEKQDLRPYVFFSLGLADSLERRSHDWSVAAKVQFSRAICLEPDLLEVLLGRSNQVGGRDDLWFNLQDEYLSNNVRNEASLADFFRNFDRKLICHELSFTICLP